jgi:6-phosphogluconate dehydrogenase (decarboxylating)
MELGFVGLGKIGMNMVERLRLFTRFRSRVDSEGRGSFAERLLAVLRNEFGGHAIVENRE